MSVCVLVPYNPFMATHGNAVRVRALLRALSRSHRVRLFAYDLPGQGRVEHWSNVLPYFFAVRAEIVAASTAVRALLGMSSYDLLTANFDPVRGFSRRLSRFVEREQVALVQCENVVTVPPVVRSRQHLDLPVVVTAHDVWSDRMAELWRLQGVPRAFWTRLVSLARRLEVEGINECDACVCVSEEDRSRLIELGVEPERLVVIPNGVDTRRIRPLPRDENLMRELGLGGEDFVLFFAGSDMYQNRAAVDDIFGRILHRVGSRVKLLLAGSICGYARRRVPSGLKGRVMAVGYVEDLCPYYSLADVVVLPIRYGTGTKLKAVEAMAAGKAILSTKKGISGLDLVDGVDALVEDNLGEFRSRIEALIGDNGFRESLGKRARLRSLEYDWDLLLERYEEIYRSLG